MEVFMLTAGIPAVLGTKRLSSNADMMREAIERGSVPGRNAGV